MRKFTFRWLLSLLMITSLAFVSNAQYLTESFEGDFPPTDWTMLNNGAGNAWTQNTTATYASDGTKSLKYGYNSSNAADAWAFTPAITLTAGTSIQIIFDYRTLPTYSERLRITYGTAADIASITDTIFEYDGVSTSYLNELITLTVPTDGDYYFAFNCYSIANQNQLHVDNIIIQDVPTCPNPTDLTATSITAFTADLGWTNGNAESAWNLKVSTTEIDAATEAADVFDGAASANPHPISGLNADSDYYYYVQANCGTDDLSDWVGPFAFSTLISCPAPTGLVVADITQTSALLKWVSGGASNYNLFYGPADFVMTEGTEVLLEDTFLLVSDLISATEYEFYVQDSCADGDASVWVGPFAFTTECGTLTAPHAENFDGVSTPNLPICWNSLIVATSTYVKVETSTSQASSGSNSVHLYNSYTTDPVILLISPEYSDLSSQLNRIRFKAHMTDSGLEVGTMTDPTDASTFTLLETIPENGGAWEQYIVNLDTYAGTDSYIAFKHTYETSADHIYFDDYSYEAIPSCFMPSALAVSNITGSSADLAWTTGGATEWDIEWDVAGFSPLGVPTIENTTNNPYSLEGLTAQTEYEFYVRDDCSTDNSDASQWVGPFAFKTECAANFTLPFTEGFEAGFENFINTDGNDEDFTIETTIIKEGVNSIHTEYSAYSENAIVTQCNVDLTGNNNPQLSFWHIAKTEGYWDKCYVKISYDGGAFENLPTSTYEGDGDYASAYFDEDSYSEWGTGSETPDNTWWKKETFNLTDYNTSSNVIIKFELSGDSGTERDGWYIDDIIIQNITCANPTDLGIENLTFASADLTWLDNEASNWNVEYGLDGFVMGEGTTVPVTDTVASISSLEADTDYSFYVQADCGSSESTWAGPFNFTTALSCPAPTALTLYDYTATTATFTWVTGNSDNWNIEYGDEDFVQGTGTFVEIEDTFYIIEGLTPETTYEFYVQDSCGTGDESLWTGPASVTTTSTCPQPIELMASPLGVSATLSWNGLFATHWDIEWDVAGFTNVGTPTIDNNSETSVIITDLTEGTEYEFYVRADCGSDDTDVSEWTGPYSFTTLVQGQACALPTEYGNINGPAIDAYIDLGVYNWYTVVLDQKYADVTFSLCGSPIDTRLWVYEACNTDYLAYNDDNYTACSSSASHLTIDELQAGTYYVRMDEYGQNTASNYTLEITGSLPNTENEILTFEFSEQTGESIIDPIAHTVNIIVPFGTEVSDMTPTYTLSIGATTDQETTDFSSDVLYNIVAQDEVTSQAWTVIVSITPPSTDNDFLSFSFAEETTTETIINTTDHTIAIEVGSGTLPAALVATFSISQFATINIAGLAQVSGTTPNAFVYGTAFEYTVVAENGDEQIWNVTVTEADIFSEALFLAYSLEHQASPAVIDNVAKTINIDVHPCVELTALVASFELSYNATTSINDVAQVSGLTANDFTLPVIDTVTAENGTSLGIYTITVNQLSPIVTDYPYLEDFEGTFLPTCWSKVLPGGSSANDITQSSTENHTEGGEFSARFSSYSSASDYNQFLITASFTVDPMYSELSFWHRKYYSNPDELYFGIATTTDTSWTTINLVQDEWNQELVDLSMYNGQDIFFIFHYNGDYDYYVYVDDLTIKQSGNTDITVYDVPGQLGTTEIVSENDSIQVMMPFGTAWPVTFAADFELISATTTVDGAEQTSTVTENTWVDNTTPVVYTVTAQDGTIKEWSVYVDVALNPAKEILTYAIAGEDVVAVIDDVAAEIHVTMPIGTVDFTDLIATFTISDDATVAIAGVAQESAVTMNTWATAPLVYTVTAQDGTTKDWSVFVAAALNFENEILTFSIDGQESATTPDPANPIIDIVMAPGTPDLSGLIATFTLSDAATAKVGTNLQVSEVTSNNWSTGTVVYDVAAENGTVKEWTINVTVAPFSGTEFISYVISGQDGLTDIITENDSIHIYMLPTVENITDRIATFELSEGATAVVNGMDQESGTTENDFSNSGVTPVIYTVTAGDGTVREWKVVVDLTVGINEIVESKDIQVYPNPNNGLFELAINIANLETVNLEVVNTQGQLVSTFNDVNTKIAQSLDLSELAAGVYYIKVITEKETLVKKVNILK